MVGGYTNRLCRSLNEFQTGLEYTLAKSRLNKDELKGAKFLKQIDQKYLLVKSEVRRMRPTSGHGSLSNHFKLLLIDQHAADERVRLEALLSSSFNSRLVKMKSPIGFHFRTNDLDAIHLASESLARWGIKLSQTQINSDISYITIHRISALISKCLPDLKASLRDLVYTYIADSQNGHYIADCNSANNCNWFTAMTTCPRQLYKCVCSKACRSI